MATNTKIELVEAMWNPLAGCEPSLSIPLKKKKPTMWFVNSMSDLFHEDVPFEFIDKVFAVMALCPQHTFLVLTKRAERLAEYFSAHDVGLRWALAVHELQQTKKGWPDPETALDWDHNGLPNVWLGVSVENQKRADERIPHLLKCPAAVRFLSSEPLLGSVDLRKHVPGWRRCNGCGKNLQIPKTGHPKCDCGGQRRSRLSGFGGYGISPVDYLDWVIVGGESGPQARPCHIDWIRSIIKQCRDADVPCFVKQLGSKPYKIHRVARDSPGIPAGEVAERVSELKLKHPKGGDPEEWPEGLKIREMPRGAAGTATN